MGFIQPLLLISASCINMNLIQSINVISFVLLHFLSIISAAKWVKIGGKEYEFNPLGMTHSFARGRCAGMGAKLFEPKDAATNGAVFTQAGIELATDATRLWIGVSDIDTEDSFTYTSDAQPVTFPCDEPGSTQLADRGGCWRPLQPITELTFDDNEAIAIATQDLNCVFGTAAQNGKWQTSNCNSHVGGQPITNAAAATAGIAANTYDFTDMEAAKFGSICERDVTKTTAAPSTTAAPTGTSDSTCLKSGITVMIGMLFFCYQ